MGYRSDIRVLLLKSEFDKMQFELSLYDIEGKELLSVDELSTYEIVKIHGTEYVLFGWEYIKWYDSVGIVSWLMSHIMEAIDADAADGNGVSAFVRIGEDTDDIEHIGSWDYLNVSRSIEVDGVYESIRDVKAESEEKRRLNK